MRKIVKFKAEIVEVGRIDSVNDLKGVTLALKPGSQLITLYCDSKTSQDFGRCLFEQVEIEITLPVEPT